MSQVLANAVSQGYSSTLAADRSNSSVNTALMFTISCQNHACNRETISHCKIKILFAMMNSGTKPSPTQKREGRTWFESRRKEEKSKKLNRKFIVPLEDCGSEGTVGKEKSSFLFLWTPSRTSLLVLNKSSWQSKKELPKWGKELHPL